MFDVYTILIIFPCQIELINMQYKLPLPFYLPNFWRYPNSSDDQYFFPNQNSLLNIQK
jgi:hypothetical protein